MEGRTGRAGVGIEEDDEDEEEEEEDGGRVEDETKEGRRYLVGVEEE